MTGWEESIDTTLFGELSHLSTLTSLAPRQAFLHGSATYRSCACWIWLSAEWVMRAWLGGAWGPTRR